jgi:hypothetical protein
MIKPKIFIRFRPGAMGNFISTLLTSLVREIELHDPLLGNEFVEGDIPPHNFEKQYLDEEFEYYTGGKANLERSINYFRRNFYIRDALSEDPFIPVVTHAVNPQGILSAFDNSKLINIHHTESETDQIVYNVVIKTVTNKYFFVMPLLLRRFKTLHPNKLSTVKSVDKENIHLIMYIYKFLYYHEFENFVNFSTEYPTFNITYKSIVDETIIDRLSEIADFIGVDLKKDRHDGTVDIIKKYVAGQQGVVYNGPPINFNDYD